MKFSKREVKRILIQKIGLGSSHPICIEESGPGIKLLVSAYENVDGAQVIQLEKIIKSTGEVITKQYQLATDTSFEVKLVEILDIESDILADIKM